jgi:hypothetical protein
VPVALFREQRLGVSLLLTVSQKVLPEAVVVGNPAFKYLESWMPDRTIRA